MNNLLIVGYFGHGNMGDEALLEVTVKRLKAAVPELDVTVFTARPDETADRLGVHAQRGGLAWGAGMALWRADAVLIGPGGIFQDVTSVRSVRYYAGIVSLAKMRKKPVFWVGHGVGPLNSPVARRLFAQAARKADLILVRDAGSAILGMEIAPDVAFVVGSDLGWLLEPEDTDRVKALEAEMTGSHFIGLNLRPTATEDISPAFAAEFAQGLIEGTDWKVLLLPFQDETDRPLLQAAAERLGDRAHLLPQGFTPGEILAAIRHLSGLAAMRYHALIAGALAKIPIAGIAYDPKVIHVLEQLGLEPVCSADWARDPAEAAQAARAAIQEFPLDESQYRGKVDLLRGLAESALEQFTEAVRDL